MAPKSWLSSLSPIGLGVAFQATNVDIPLKFLGALRSPPSVSVHGTIVGYSNAAVAFATDNVGVISGSAVEDGCMLRAVTSSDMTIGTTYTVYLRTGGYIDLSAEL